VTYASHRPDDDLCYDLCDVVSQNLYPGWYGDPEVDDRLALIVPKLQRCREDLNRRGHGLKPYILSEIGAEAIYGWRDPLNNFYTEEFQAAYLDTVCAEVVGHPYYAGLALWHFADARTCTGEPAMRRPRCFNNKGTLDEYRRPKAAYAVVRRHFRKAFGLEV
jgi:beta-glucuronidase